MARAPRRLTIVAGLRRVLAYTAVGGMIGWLHGYLESIEVAAGFSLLLLFFAVPAINFLQVFRGLFIPILHGLALNYATIVMTWVAYATALPNTAIPGHYELWVTLFIILLAIFLHLPAAITLLVWTLLDEGRIRTTNCLGCGYSLLGLKTSNCPECGKSFTLYEQGITAEELCVN